MTPSSPSPPSLFFSKEELAHVNLKKKPRHVAIIPDGNRRWAKKEKTANFEGHREGAHTLIDIVKGAKDLKIEFLTFYLFSTENWNRSQEEVEALMWLLNEFLIDQKTTMIENAICLETIGDLTALPEHVQKTISEVKQATSACRGITMIFAINYGSRAEICQASLHIAQDVLDKKITLNQINETLFSNYLYTNKWPDPDLLIRTSGEMRLSNFLLWQISYSEIYICPELWPKFTPHHLLEALLSYQNRERRLGGE